MADYTDKQPPYTEATAKSEYARREYSSAVSHFADIGFSQFNITGKISPFEKALGLPLGIVSGKPTVSSEYLGRDDICEIFRLRICVLPQLPFYGLVFVPFGISGKLPLVIAAHGNLGTPELMYGMHGKNGYSNLIRRLLSRGVAVFSPQLLMWNSKLTHQKPCYETDYDRVALDSMLKEKGGSITALEVFCIMRSIDALSGFAMLDSDKIGACGMSYGAFFTMRTMAIDKRIKCGYFLSCFDGGHHPDFPEWDIREGEESYSDGKIAALIAPRPIMIEVGKNDEFFSPERAAEESLIPQEAYRYKSAENNFRFSVWDGTHIVPPHDTGIDFLVGNLWR